MYSRYKRQQILDFARMGLGIQVKSVWLRKTTSRLQAADYLLHATRGGFNESTVEYYIARQMVLEIHKCLMPRRSSISPLTADFKLSLVSRKLQNIQF